MLAVERINNLEVGDENFEYPAGFDPEAMLERAFGMVCDDPLEVRIWFSADQARYIQERKWALEQKISKRKDGSIVLWMRTSGWYDVKRWILSFGQDAEILEPLELREEVLEELRNNLERYGRQTDSSTSRPCR